MEETKKSSRNTQSTNHRRRRLGEVTYTRLQPIGGSDMGRPASCAAEGQFCRTVRALLSCSAAPRTGKTSGAGSGPINAAVIAGTSVPHHSLRGDADACLRSLPESSCGLRWVFTRVSPVLQSVCCFSNLLQEKGIPGESGGSSWGDPERRWRSALCDRSGALQQCCC